MSPRVAGAALAFLAAILLLASAAGIPSGWWAGHPLKNGMSMVKKDVDVTMLSAVGCNTGGDGTCEPLPMSGGFSAVRYVELGASGILVLAVLLLAATMLASSERRKRFAMIVIALAVICAMIALALIFMPKMPTANISLPIGAGMFVFWGGIVCAVLASVLAMRPTPKLELQPSRQSFAPAVGAPPPAQPVDVLALLQQDQLRPGSLGPEPMIGRPPPSPGGMLAGPSGPLAPPNPASSPLFANAPQLRPLYDAGITEGGTGGYVPGEPAQLPTPDPVRRSQIGAAVGIPTPTPFGATEPPLVLPPTPLPTTTPFVRPAGTTAPPPPPAGDRPKSASTAPPLPGVAKSGSAPGLPGVKPLPAAEARAKAASIVPPLARPKPPSIAPPARISSPPSTVAGIVPPPARAKGATGLPPPRPGASASPVGGISGIRPPQPTTVAAVVPPPPSAPLLPMMLPTTRADTDPVDNLETVDRDAMTIQRDGAPNVTVGRPGTDPPIGEHLDASVAFVGPGPMTATDDIATVGIEKLAPRDSASDIQTSAQRKLTPSELLRTVARESQSEIETIAREKISAAELAVGDSTSPVIGLSQVSTASEAKELGEAPTARAPANIPVSTAPESLPPPKGEEVATSGPTPACPQCEAPMAWVEEHLRFYCKSCRMYF